MSIQSILRFIFISVAASVITLRAAAQQPDSAAHDTVALTPHLPDSAGHQFVFGIDVVRPISNLFASDRQGYEFTADYYLKNEVYLVGEGGWGNSNVSYPDLKYRTSNTFARLGINKSVFARVSRSDWDFVFIGLRYGMAFVQRNSASYTVQDSLWGNVNGSLPAAQLTAYWAEITGGLRVEILPSLCAGWTARGKFLLDASHFRDLAPLYIAGYGRGDKNAVFDFDFYISYAFRWSRKSSVAPPPGQKNEQ